MEERKRNHLTLEIKNYIVLEKIRKPRRTVRDLVHDLNLKYEIKPSIGAIHNVGPKNKKRSFAQNRFFTLYTKLKSSASRSRKPVSEGPERLGAFLKKFPKVRKRAFFTILISLSLRRHLAGKTLETVLSDS